MAVSKIDNGLQDQINDLNSNISKSANSLITTGLTFSKCSYVRGGYCRIGNIIIIELRIKITSGPNDWDYVITGFPTTSGQEIPLNLYDVNGYYIPGDIYNQGIRCTKSSNWTVNHEINISGIYLTV